MREVWEYKKLGEVCDVVTGSTPKTNEPSYWGGANYWVTPAELKGNLYVNSTERTITEEAVKNTNLSLMPVGTVLLSSRAPIGKVAITQVPMYCNQGFKNLICKETINNKYLYWFLWGKTDFLNSLGRGATFKEISKSIVEKIQIPLPPIPQQRLIVSELDEINSLLALKREQLKKYDELAQSLFYEMFGDPVENEKGWEVKKLGDLTVRTAYNGPIQCLNEKYWLLNLDMVESQTGKIISKVYVTNDEIGNSTTSFNNEYVLYSKLRPYLNKVVLPDTSGYCTTELVPIKPKKDLDRFYLCYLLRSSSFVNMITIKVAGAKMPRVTMRDFWEFMLPLPPLSLQRTFAHRIEQIEEQKKQITASIAKLETLLASRMQYWFE